VKILSRDGNSQSSNVLSTTGDEVALSLVPTDVYADMVTDISLYFLNPINIKYKSLQVFLAFVTTTTAPRKYVTRS